MKVNGNITLNALGQSEVQNLVIERVSATPVFSASEAGRIVYNTVDRLYYMNTGEVWVSLATGGNAALLQDELDRVQASLGSSVTGSGEFNPTAFNGSNIVNAQSLTDAINQLDASITGKNELSELLDVALGTLVGGEALIYDVVSHKWVSKALTVSDISDLNVSAEELNHVSGLTRNVKDWIESEVLAREAAIDDVEDALSAEVSRATGVEAQLAADLATEVSRATAAEGVLTSNLATEATTRANADSALSTRVDVEAAARIAADEVLQDAVEAEQTRATAAELDLSNRVTAEVADRTAEDTRLAGLISTESATRSAADLQFRADLDAEITARSLSDTQIRSEFQTLVAGLSWKQAVRVALVENVDLAQPVTEVDGVVVAQSDRVLVMGQTDKAQNGIYVVGADGVLVRAEDMNDAAEFSSAAFFVEEGTVYADTGFTQTNEVVAIGTDPISFVQFNGAAGIIAGAGMIKDGNTLRVASTSGTITVTEDSIDVSQGVLDSISANATAIAAEKARAETAESGLSDRIDDETAAREAADTAMTSAYEAADLVEKNARIAADAALQASIDAEVARASAAEDLLTANLASEVSRATAAEGVLTAAVAAEQARATAAEGALQTAIAAEQARAEAAEGVLTTAVATEKARAEAAEAALAAKVGKGYFLYDGAAATEHVVTHNIGSQFCNVTVIDSASNEQIIPQSVIFESANVLRVTFNVALAAKVVVMGLAV